MAFNTFQNKIIRLFFLTITVSLISGSSFCQDDNIDGSLIFQETLKTADSLNRLCSETWDSDRKLAMYYAEQALEISETADYDIGKGTALKNIGNINLFTGKYNEAIVFYEISIRIKSYPL